MSCVLTLSILCCVSQVMIGKYNLGKNGDFCSAAPLAILVPVLPAKDRILKPFVVVNRVDDKTGFYQVIRNTETGKEWNVGREYDVEGYVLTLNRDILRGKFS